jgi:hypothetical protein
MKRNVALVTFQVLAVACAAAAARNQHTITPAEIGAEIQDRLYHAQVFKHGNVNVAWRSRPFTSLWITATSRWKGWCLQNWIRSGRDRMLAWQPLFSTLKTTCASNLEDDVKPVHR